MQILIFIIRVIIIHLVLFLLFLILWFLLLFLWLILWFVDIEGSCLSFEELEHLKCGIVLLLD
jgi:hypothetical protein